MKVSTRLGLSFGSLLVILACMTLLAIHGLGALNAGTVQIVSEDWRQSTLANVALDNARGSIARVFQLTAETDEKQAANARERLAINTKEFQEALVMLAPMVVMPEGKAMVTRATESGAKYVATYEKTLALVAEGKPEEASKHAFSQTYPTLHAFAADLRKLNDFLHKQVEQAGMRSEQTFQSTRMTVIGLGAAAVLLGIFWSWLVARSITRPLNQAVQIAQAVAEGDLTSRIEVKSRDETGQLLQALKVMNESLVRIVGQVRAGTDLIASASTQIATGNLDLSKRTEAQASSLERTVSSMEEITSTVKQNAGNASQANQLALAASEVAVKGGAVVSEVVGTMASINESSKKIGDIIGVIDGIAFQTNILALNAAVEAARAGEQGQGFAVVAGEVRNLAQRSAGAAKEIKALIGDSVDKVDAGARLVDQAGTTMQDVVANIARVADIMSKITAASQEQTTGIEQINQAMTQIDRATQQNASLVEEATAASKAMQDEAASLAQLTSVFRLDTR